MIGNAFGIHPARAKLLIEDSRCDQGLFGGWHLVLVALHGVDETKSWDVPESQEADLFDLDKKRSFGQTREKR